MRLPASDHGLPSTRRVAGAIVIGIASATGGGARRRVAVPAGAWLRMPRFDTFFQADLRSTRLPFLPLLLSLVMVDFFDTIGTVTAIAETGKLDDERDIPRLRRDPRHRRDRGRHRWAFGVSSVTSYIESAAGVAEGARTGLHSSSSRCSSRPAFSPLRFAVVPGAATAPALIIVGFLMCQQITRMDFTTLETAIPAFLILLMTPLTFSISHGIGYGFVAYVAIKFLGGRGGKCSR